MRWQCVSASQLTAGLRGPQGKWPSLHLRFVNRRCSRAAVPHMHIHVQLCSRSSFWHTHKGQNRDYFKGFPHVVVIAPMPTKSTKRGLQLTACCAVTLETHEWLGVNLSLGIMFNNPDRPILSTDMQNNGVCRLYLSNNAFCVCMCVLTWYDCVRCFFNSSGAICSNREMHFVRRRGSQTGKWYAAFPKKSWDCWAA